MGEKLRWREPLYVGARAEEKKEKLIKKLNRGAGTVDVWLVTAALNRRDLFDVFSAAYLKQPALRRNLPEIVGLAVGRDEAMEIVRRIVEETYERLGNADVRQYLRIRQLESETEGTR